MDVSELTNLWNYYMCLEKDLEATSRYIEPQGQEDTYSYEFCKIIILGCSEIENIFKMICLNIDNSKECGNIGEYKGKILSKYPRIIETEVSIPRWNYTKVNPFKGWDSGPLDWWDVYTKLKHHRVSSMKIATYHNAVKVLSALYVLIAYLRKIFNLKVGFVDNYIKSSYNGTPIFYVEDFCTIPDFEGEENL